MAKTCGKCGNKIGMFAGSSSCSHVDCDCDYVECNSCFEKNDNLIVCKTCDETFCKKHIESMQHECEEVEEITDEDDEDISYQFVIEYENGDVESKENLKKKVAEKMYNDFKALASTEARYIEFDYTQYKDFDKVVVDVKKSYNLDKIYKFYWSE